MFVIGLKTININWILKNKELFNNNFVKCDFDMLCTLKKSNNEHVYINDNYKKIVIYLIY